MSETTPDPKAIDDTHMPDAVSLSSPKASTMIENPKPAPKTETGPVAPGPRPPPPKLGPRTINNTGPDKTQGPIIAEVNFKEAENIIKDPRRQLTDTKAKVTLAESEFRDAAATANQRGRQLEENEAITKRFQDAHDKLGYKYDKLYNNHQLFYQTTTDQLEASREK